MSIILNHKSNQCSSLQQCILTFFFYSSQCIQIFFESIVGKVLTYAGSFNLQRKNIYHHSGIHKLPNWRNIHQIVHWKNRMKGIRCYMTAIMNKEGTEKHKKLKSRSICGKWSLNKILILIGTLVIQKFKSVSYRKFRLE